MSAIFSDTQTGFVLVAMAVCSIMAGVAVQLMERAGKAKGRARLAWMSLIAPVGGLGVWTTHFIAMLGFRPDMILAFNPELTALSALIGVVFVGLPLAGAAAAPARWRPAFGLAAGAGVGAIHFTGMDALEGCLVFHDPILWGSAFLAGMLAFAGALRLAAGRQLAAAALIVVGVCTLHFTALAGTRLSPLPDIDPGMVDPLVLTAFLALAVLFLCAAAFMAVVGSARLDAQRQQAADQMAAQYKILATALESMSNGLVKVGPDRRIRLCNRRALELLSITEADLHVGMPVETFLRNLAARHDWDAARTELFVASHLNWYELKQTSRDEYQFGDDRVLSISCRATPGGGATLTFDDISEKHSAQAALNHMAGHDALTGLPNRLSFREESRRLIATQREVGLLMINFDRFHAVNDVFGLAVGDAALRQTAIRLRECCRTSDLVFRMDGDEFAVLPQPFMPGIAEALARRIVTTFDKSVIVEGHTLRIGCSVGLATFGGSKDENQLMQRAALALKRAKALGGGRIEHYVEGMVERAVERRHIESDLADAAAANAFELAYQPLYGLPDRNLRGFEALIRWNHPKRGRVSPADFVPLAEENGMILPIGAWVLDEACRQLSEWPSDLHVAINVSPVEMRSEGLVERVMLTLDRYGVEPHRLELELTETALVEDSARISATLARFRSHGVRIAMDDFGTGYSSLQHLRDFQIDRIKIDRRFVDTACDDLGSMAVTRAVIGLARDLSIETTAEGVETAEQLARLIAFGCDNAQGYYLGRPLSLDAAKALVAEANLRRAG